MKLLSREKLTQEREGAHANGSVLFEVLLYQQEKINIPGQGWLAPRPTNVLSYNTGYQVKGQVATGKVIIILSHSGQNITSNR